jgi:hypothetical protein
MKRGAGKKRSQELVKATGANIGGVSGLIANSIGCSYYWIVTFVPISLLRNRDKCFMYAA